jgi:hypothetical protein
MDDLSKEIGKFFEKYAEAFDSIDGHLARLYHVPTVTLRADGSIHCLTATAAVASASLKSSRWAQEAPTLVRAEDGWQILASTFDIG